MNLPKREVVINDAVRAAVPLWFCNFGASGSGKTYTALELATGIQQVTGGDIYGLDTEGNRMLAYADYFKFKHVPMSAPYGSLDYLAFLDTLRQRGARIVIIDSLSHEHESVGGMLDFQEQEVKRMAGDDWQKAERVKGLAWTKPKAARRQLLNSMVAMKDVSFVLCFRAADTTKPMKVKDDKGKEKTEFQHMGFTPIGGREFVYEATVSFFLPPASKGVPLWDSENPSERMMSKLPKQFENVFKNGQQLSREHGRIAAEWARGGSTGASAAKSEPPPVESKPRSGKSDAERVEDLKAALKRAATIADVNTIWNHHNSAVLRNRVDPATLDELGLLYESRIVDLEAARKESA